MVRIREALYLPPGFLGKHCIKVGIDRLKLGARGFESNVVKLLNDRSIRLDVATHLVDVPI